MRHYTALTQQFPSARIHLLKPETRESKILSKLVEKNKPPKVNMILLSWAGRVGQGELCWDYSSLLTVDKARTFRQLKLREINITYSTQER